MADTDLVELADLSRIIGAIYDCALEPDRWQKAVNDIAGLCDSPIGNLGINNMKDAGFRRVYDSGFHPGFIEAYPKYAAENPIFPAAFLHEIGAVNTQAMLIDEAEFLESRFYHKCLKPFNYRDTVGFLALKTGERVAFMSLIRTLDEPLFGDREVQLLRLLSPHVCRTLRISDALDLRTLTSEMLEATLDTLAAGVYLLDAEGRVVHLNVAAERQLQASQALHIQQERLFARDPQSHAALMQALAAASSCGAPAPVAPGTTIALANGAEPGFIATVLPIDRGQRRGVFAPFAAAAAVFVQDPAVTPQMPGEAFAKLHGLTGGELRVLLAMMPGLGVKEAADMLGIAEATARTHLSRIFAKTGTAKQAELVHLLMASAPPVAG